MSDAKGSNNPKKDFLPQDKRLRLIVQIVIAAVGIYAIISGIRQIMGS